MKPTARETAAAHALANALLEFALATEEGRAARRPQQPAPEPQPPSTKEHDRELLTAREAAAMLSVSQGTLFNIRAPKGPLPFVRIGCAVRYRVDDLRQVIENRRVKRKDSDEDRDVEDR